MNICALVNLSNWKKQKDILLELHREYGINTTDRKWRHEVAIWNEKFELHEVPYYITHSSKYGFKATTDYEEAQFGRNDDLRRIVSLAKKIRSCDRAFGNLKNYRIDFKKGEIVCDL